MPNWIKNLKIAIIQMTKGQSLTRHYLKYFKSLVHETDQNAFATSFELIENEFEVLMFLYIKTIML